MCTQAHCLYFVLPPLASAASVQTRSKGHPYELPRRKYDTIKTVSYTHLTLPTNREV